MQPDPTGAAARLRRAGLKATGPRLLILRLLEGDRAHPTAEEVHAALKRAHPSLSLSTVYQTLDAFLRAGLCRRAPAAGGGGRVDGTSGDHDHAVCRGCGRIFDVARGRPLPAPPRRLGRGLTVTGCRLEYDVICPSCRRGGGGSGRMPRPVRAGRTVRR